MSENKSETLIVPDFTLYDGDNGSIIVGNTCYLSLPCQHKVGENGKLMSGYTIYKMMISLGIKDVDNHFSQYKNHLK